MGSRLDGKVMEHRRTVSIRTTENFADAVRDFADELGVSVSSVWVLAAALLISREGYMGAGLPDARSKALLQDVRAQLANLLSS